MFHQLLLDSATQIFFLAPLVLIGLDILLGIANALKNQSFSISWLGNFAQRNILPYAGLLITFLVLPLVSGVPYLVAAGAAKAAFGLYCLSQLESVLSNVSLLLGKQPVVNALDALINAAMARFFPFVPAAPVASADPATTPATTPATSVSDTPAQ